jgi:hypothetical protein
VREAAFAPVAAGPTGQVARLPNLRPVETVAPAEEDDDLDDDEGKRGFVSWFRRR